MRESEKNVGRADHNLAGARSTAQNETQPPEKVVDKDADRRNENGVWGDEGGGGVNPGDTFPKTKP